MSRHTIELPSTTAAGKALVVVGYDNGVKGPHFFCYVFDATEPMTTPLWNSLFTLEYSQAQRANEFGPVLMQWGITLPERLVDALTEDWAKNQLNCEYCWQQDGTFEQAF